MTKTADDEKRFFDEGRIPSDVWSVLKTASVLSIGEFRVFQIAYEQWYGEEGEEKAIENHFTSYMFNDIVPIWVRHFCKRVLRLDSEHALDPSEFGISFPTATMEQRNKGFEFIMALLFIMIVFFLIGESAAKLLKLQCMFPPCY